MNKDSILISLSKENNAFNIEVFSYNTKNKSFSSLLYKNSYNYELVENEFLDCSLIRFNKGFKVIISSSTNTFSSNIIKIDSLDKHDIEILQDMIVIAVNDANKKIKKDIEEKMGSQMGNFGSLF